MPEMRRSFLLTTCSPAHRRSAITQAFAALLASVLLTLPPSVGATPASAMPQPVKPPPRLDETTRHSLCHEGRCVVLDGTGRQLAEHRGIQYIRPFKNGLAVFERGENRGVMNSEGRIVLEANYDWVEIHDNGVIEAKVLLRKPPKAYTRIDFFNARGRLARRFEGKGENDLLRSASWAGNPAVELCNSEKRRCTTRFLDAKGKSGPVFSVFGSFGPVGHEGEVAIASRDGVHFGLVDRSLAGIGRQDYDQMTFNSSGFALATQGGNDTVLDPQGVQVAPMGRYRFEFGRGEYLISAVAEDGACLHFTRAGSMFPTPAGHCMKTDRFAERVGYVIFSSEDDEYVVGLDGSLRSLQRAAGLHPLNRRIVEYQKPGEAGVRFMMLEDGSISSSLYYRLAPFQTAEGLDDQLLLAQADGGWGVIDATGAWLIPPRYRRIRPLGLNLVAAFERPGYDPGYHILDLRGNAVADFTLHDPLPEFLADGTKVYALSLRGRWGLLDESGRWRLAPRYGYVNVSKGLVSVRERNSAGDITVNFLDPDTETTLFEQGFLSIHSRADGLFETLKTDQTLELITLDGTVLASLHHVPTESRSSN
ncbi:WG repeat-containing protein [Stenotrophomonas sp. ZAC14A_NAIMI4_1]|uniref:WG repeat-containing protein n=1 Tax=Stenotrophomonas sp. ZAC14A_NAIMI4_1 TaxID=2072412 RepID=UPI00131ED5D6|nr:WG repeat-containing protein [Stenotrophomonas sp. ZAC14A_NAIMI4_1]